jgi:hypothetical protein
MLSKLLCRKHTPVNDNTVTLRCIIYNKNRLNMTNGWNRSNINHSCSEAHDNNHKLESQTIIGALAN